MASVRKLMPLASLIAYSVCDVGRAPIETFSTTSISPATVTPVTSPIISSAATTSARLSKPSTAASSQAQYITIDGPWIILITPVSDNATAPWGVEVKSSVGDNNVTMLLPLEIGLDDESESFDYSSAYTVKNAQLAGNSTAHEELTLITGAKQFSLNPDYRDLQIIDKSSNASVSISPVPFGLNLGHDGYFNGSFILGATGPGASYDANRAINGTWGYVPVSDYHDDGYETFTGTGRQYLSNITIQEYDNATSPGSSAPFGGANPIGSPTRYDGTLDLNSVALSLPKGLDFCQKSNFTVTLNVISIDTNGSTYDNTLVIPISTRLTQSTDRCNETYDSMITLGQPFFQAAYILIPDRLTGRIFLAAANDQDLPIDVRPFNPIVPAPAAVKMASNSSNSAKKAEIVGTIFAVLFVPAWVGILGFLIRRHQRRVARESEVKESSKVSDLFSKGYDGANGASTDGTDGE